MRGNQQHPKEDTMRLLGIEGEGLRPSTVRRLIYLGRIYGMHPAKLAVRVREEDVEVLIRMGYRPAPTKSARAAE
jgi:hypothetical protein